MSILSGFFGAREAAASEAVVTVADAPVGSTLRVEAIRPSDPARADRLAALGLVEGCELFLRQRRPSYVIDLGETTIALDRSIAREIHVRVV